VAKPKDGKAIYRRRIERGLAKGLTRAAARGHARAGEGPPRNVRWTVSPADPLHKGFERVKAGETLTQTAKALGVSRERLRAYIGEFGEFRRVGRQGRIVADRRLFQLPLYTSGSLRKVIVDADGASALGRYMAAVGRFLASNDASILTPFEGRGVVDAFGKTFPFETDPNALYALDAKGELAFHQVYQIQI